MQVIRFATSLHIALVASLGVALALCQPVRAQEPPPEPDPDEQPLDQAEDESVDEPADQVEPDQAGDEEEEWQGMPMKDDEDWASEVSIDEADDAIPVDEELDPTDEDWQVTEFVDDGD